jgi:hypothetical protein
MPRGHLLKPDDLVNLPYGQLRALGEKVTGLRARLEAAERERDELQRLYRHEQELRRILLAENRALVGIIEDMDGLAYGFDTTELATLTAAEAERVEGLEELWRLVTRKMQATTCTGAEHEPGYEQLWLDHDLLIILGRLEQGHAALAAPKEGE